MYEPMTIKGVLFAYDGKIIIDQHLSGQARPVFVLPNLMPTVGRAFLVDSGSIGDIDTVKLGDDGTARTAGLTDIISEQFSASPTDSRVVGTKRVVELYVGTAEANFTHREIGLFAGTTLISTLVITPEFVKTTAKTRSYIWEGGWF